MKIRNFLVVGRGKPELHAKSKERKLAEPRIYKMRIFAPDSVTAKSRFWYYLAKLNKVKKSRGEVLSCTEVLLNKLKNLVNAKKPN
jgi:large subunit ribosomal protein L18Ae